MPPRCMVRPPKQVEAARRRSDAGSGPGRISGHHDDRADDVHADCAPSHLRDCRPHRRPHLRALRHRRVHRRRASRHHHRPPREHEVPASAPLLDRRRAQLPAPRCHRRSLPERGPSPQTRRARVERSASSRAFCSAYLRIPWARHDCRMPGAEPRPRPVFPAA